MARLDQAPRVQVDPGIVPARFPSIDRAIGGEFHRGDLVEFYEADLGISGAAELPLLKNRDGARGYVDLYFDNRYSRFEDVRKE